MYKLYFDGSCLVNPGNRSACGAIIFKGHARVWQSSVTIDEENSSNNVAEYAGLIIGLEYLREQGLQHEPIQVIGDSKLVISQMFRGWRVKSGAYVPYAYYASTIISEFTNIKGKLVPRDANRQADKLSKRYRKQKVKIIKQQSLLDV